MSLRATAPNVSSGPDVLLGTNADGTPVSWMEANWPFCSWAIFLFGSGVLVARWNTRHEDGGRWYGWLALVAYCLHQSEEHAYDIRGWRYSFVPALNAGPIADLYEEACREFYNSNSSSSIGGSGIDGIVSCPLDPKITLWVNTILIWGGFGGCMVAAELFPSRFSFSGSLNWGTAVVNGIGGHLLPAIASGTYNPGVVQSAVMVPFGIYWIVASGRPGLCLFNGIVSHLALALGVNVVFRFRTDEVLTMGVLMVLAALVVPLGLSDWVSRSSDDSKRSNNNNKTK
jgi:hypothetical protein